jgi:hypothetical protein
VLQPINIFALFTTAFPMPYFASFCKQVSCLGTMVFVFLERLVDFGTTIRLWRFYAGLPISHPVLIYDPLDLIKIL